MSCRLLYLVGQLGAGGLERQLCYLLQAMDRARYRPAVAVWNFCESEIYVTRIRQLGVPLHTFPRTLSAAAKLRAFRQLVGELNPQVVHSYSFYLNFATYWGVQGTQALPFGAVQSDFTHEKKSAGSWLGRLSARWPSAHICNSFLAAETIRHSRSLFVPQRLFVVRNGVDLARFRSVPLVTQGQAVIMGVGSLLPVKRWDRLLAAGLELRRRGFGCRIRIAGDGSLRGALERQAQSLGMSDRVKFIGQVDDIASLLSDATFLAHTSDIEGCPNAVMEAMACGRAVVATDAGDVPALVEDGKTGFIVRRGDDAMLVERMVKLITDHDLCRSMGAAGRTMAERQFGLDRLVAETLAAYRAMGWEDA